MTDSTPAVSDTPERLHIEWQVLDLRDGYAVSVFHDRVMALLRQQEAALADARRDAERWRHVNSRAEWIREDDGRDRYAMLAVRLPYDADLSCKAMRESAIDAAMSGGTTPTPPHAR